MFRIAVVEDDKNYTDNLCEMIKNCSKELDIECRVSCFKDGLDFITDYKPIYDLVFLDIEMPLLNGMDTAKRLRKLDTSVCLIFITNIAQYAISGYEVEAKDYIVKPVDYKTFYGKFKRVIKNIEQNDTNYIVLDVEGVLRKVKTKDIIYIEIRGHFLHYHLKEETLITYGVIAETEKNMEQYGFFRIYKSYLVNLEYVEEVKLNSVIVGGTDLPVSRFRKKEFITRLANFFGDR